MILGMSIANLYADGTVSEPHTHIETKHSPTDANDACIDIGEAIIKAANHAVAYGGNNIVALDVTVEIKED